MADDRHLEKDKLLYLSKGLTHIDMKFCMLMHIGLQRYSKNLFLKWRRAAILKNVKCESLQLFGQFWY